MAKSNSGATAEEQTSLSANQEADKTPANFKLSDSDASAGVREQNLKAAEQLQLEVSEDEDGNKVVERKAAIGINPSSTFPGRDKELAENDMRIPTVIDLAKRAKFAGTQIPEAVYAAGLVSADGEIMVDLDEPAADDTDEDNS